MDIFDSALKMASALNELSKLKAKKIHQKRCAAQNNPITKSRKSRKMKEYWAKKKKLEKEKLDEEEYIRNYKHESCYCHLGNPPCGFCTDSNYCEECDCRTLYDECPKCGKILGE